MQTIISLNHDYFPAFARHLVEDQGYSAERLLEVICENWKWIREFEAFVLDRTKDLPKWTCAHCNEVELMTRYVCSRCYRHRTTNLAAAEAIHLRGLADFGEREERQGELRGMDYGTVYER